MMMEQKRVALANGIELDVVDEGPKDAPTLIFLPEAADGSQTALQAAVAVMPGAFERQTTLAMFTWIRDKAYESQPNFQKYFADNFATQN